MKALYFSLVMCSVVFAQRPDLDSLESVVKNDTQNVDAMFELAKLYYNMVSQHENNNATKRAEEIFKTILQKKKDHTEAMVYYGSLLTLKGRDAIMPWSKLSYVEEGCEVMDKAVRLDPHNIKLRVRRAMNNINLPDSFNRQTCYLGDFEFIRNHRAFLTFTPDFQQQILFYSALAYKKNNEPDKSREMYQQVLDINKDSEFAQRAREALTE